MNDRANIYNKDFFLLDFQLASSRDAETSNLHALVTFEEHCNATVGDRCFFDANFVVLEGALH